MRSFVPSKKFSQNFLIDKNVLERIVDSCSFKSNETVLEIGPGQGALTRVLLPRVKEIIAVEADGRLVSDLRSGFIGQPFSVHHGDILKFDISSVAAGSCINVVGNVPYNISTPIVERMIAQRRWIGSLLMTVQFEFAKRLIAPVGSKDYGVLTCLVRCFSQSAILFRINSRAFRPMPNVESCFVRIDFRREPLFSLDDAVFFEKLLRLVFCQRRKTILNALGTLAPRGVLSVALRGAGISEKSRPEDVSVEEYARLSNLLGHVSG
ncbi:MAG: ribosomal RNA small subunit methyltransferase A [Candidatus Omnitrophica bacterium]|nr:ribosomal RNA small subunit methyltransferase A [Candidatus Omnitrophota bacterium]